MVTLAQLWLPILAAAVAVFFASSLVHMLFKWHNSDFRELSNENEVRAAIRKSNPVPGIYVLPKCNDMKQLQSPEFQQKRMDGPVGFLLLMPNGPASMGKPLGQWFALNLAIAFITAYLAEHTLFAGAPPMHVLRVTGTITFLAYAAGSAQAAIWAGKPWRSALKEVGDGLIYGAVSGASFALLWPHAIQIPNV